MTINQWLQNFSSSTILLIYFISLPLLAFMCGFLHQRKNGERGNTRYIYSVLTYLSTIPAAFSATLILYGMFFVRTNLLNVNVLVYFLPLLSAFATLMIISKQAQFSKLPWFDKLSGLLMMLGVTFAILLFIYKTRIFIGFFGSFEYLLVLGIVVFLLLKWSMKKMFS
ncbi:MAG: hypothetical protein GQ569_04270 [Methylococcaceae bacterium]|nr:hypothetical protein [Methylococcaceae bacterium]